MRSPIFTAMISGVTIFLLVAGITGCSQQTAKKEITAEETPTQKESTPSSDLMIGVENDEAIALSIKNDTGKTITDVRFKSTDAAEYSSNIMIDNQTWESEQVATLSFEGTALEEITEPTDEHAMDAAAIEASRTGEPLILNDVYDIQFTTADGAVFSLHQLSLTGLSSVENIAVNYDATSGFGYLTYSENGVEESTLEGERHTAAASAAIAAAMANTTA